MRIAANLPAAAAAGRIAMLDGVRGVAVMGILLMNIAAFAMPFSAYDNPTAYGPARGIDIAWWAANFVLADGKFRAIFSALFGASLLLVTDRAAAAGRSPARAHYARMIWLLPFGLAHLCLVWSGDILTLYALIGLIAYPARKLPIERLLVLAFILIVFQAIVLGAYYASLGQLRDAALRVGGNPADLALWRSTLDDLGPLRPVALAQNLALHRGPWLALVRDMIGNARLNLISILVLAGPETLALMLLGMAGLKSGLLAGRWSPTACRRLAGWSYALGLPPTIAIALLLVRAGFPPLLTATLTDFATLPLRILLAAGHVALLALWLPARLSSLKAGIAAAGRMALTNYLATSLVMTGLFYGWGLGLYGRVERIALLPIVLVMWALMLLWSPWWMARFTYGPFEYLWRLLARNTRPVWRKAIAS